jgi:hypothetical protein
MAPMSARFCDGTIETTGQWPEGLDFKFPRRDWARARYGLWFLIGLCLTLEYWLLAEPVVRVIRGAHFGNLLWLAVWAFLAFQVGRYPLWHLLTLLYGHREIGLRSDWLYAGERLGVFCKSKRWPVSRVKQVQIVDLVPQSRAANEFRATVSAAGREVPRRSAAPNSVAADLVRHLNALTAVLNDGNRIVLALAYPRSLLDTFSQELSKQIAIARREAGGDESDRVLVEAAEPGPSGTVEATQPVETAPAIGLPELFAEATEARRKALEPDVFEQPPDSNVQVESFQDGVTLRIPSLGIWKGSGGTFQIGLFFLIVTAAFTVLFAGAGIAQGGAVIAPGLLGAIGMMSIFWLASGAILYVGWMMGTRETAVAVVADRVMVIQTGLAVRNAANGRVPKSKPPASDPAAPKSTISRCSNCNSWEPTTKGFSACWPAATCQSSNGWRPCCVRRPTRASR